MSNDTLVKRCTCQTMHMSNNAIPTYHLVLVAALRKCAIPPILGAGARPLLSTAPLLCRWLFVLVWLGPMPTNIGLLVL